MPTPAAHHHPSAALFPAGAVTTILPVELLVAIFENLDGRSLVRCSAVCSTWATVIHNYDDVLWRNAARKDLDHDGGRMFWSLRVPDPRVFDVAPTHNAAVLDPSDSETDKPAAVISASARRKRTWRDMYRITRNWYTANARGHFPRVVTSSSSIPAHLFPVCVVGSPQESSFNTTLTLTHHGLIVRSNPSYRLPDGSDARVILMQDPRTGKVIQVAGDWELGWERQGVGFGGRKEG
ncbi:hypothetical protein BC937DRAFT_87558 [Endogone sp. FLAS-F59071]|nr:hypothetical protein BC937DRAFT_87558 [Endogone sp. FLAS-F59071]|eukprot:RUS12545.1 hypothetical protein BC937DRAFT_87558 [Endogone sp. FLAS-F59071]